MRRWLGIICVAAAICSIASSVFLISRANKNIPQTFFPINQIDHDCLAINPSETINLPKVEDKELTCTGLTYDSDDGAFWICNYGKDAENDPSPQPSLVCFDIEKREIQKVIKIDYLGATNLQGITYDTKSQTLWYTTGDYLVNITKQGETISRFKTDYQYNGLLYDETDDTLLVLCYKRYLLTISKTNRVLSKTSINYENQDHICFDEQGKLLITVGNSYKGEDNYIVEFDRSNNALRTKYQARESYAIEGIACVGKKLYVCNDGLYHEAKILNNWINVYDCE